MNEELREILKRILSQDELLENIVALEYEYNDSSHSEVIERVSTVYEVSTMKEGFD